MDLINLKERQEDAKAREIVDKLAGACCFYALRDITQEVNTLISVMARIHGKPTDILADVISAEDLQLLVESIDLQQGNLARMSTAIKRSMRKYNKDKSTDKEKLKQQRREWDTLISDYRQTHETIIDHYLDKIPTFDGSAP